MPKYTPLDIIEGLKSITLENVCNSQLNVSLQWIIVKSQDVCDTNNEVSRTELLDMIQKVLDHKKNNTITNRERYKPVNNKCSWYGLLIEKYYAEIHHNLRPINADYIKRSLNSSILNNKWFNSSVTNISPSFIDRSLKINYNRLSIIDPQDHSDYKCVSMKFKIFPSVEQVKMYNEVFAVKRFIYNNCIEFYNYYKEQYGQPPSKTLMRQTISKNNSIVVSNNLKWLRRFYAEFRADVVIEFYNALTSTKARQGNRPFTFSFLTKKSEKQNGISVKIPNRFWGKETSWYRRLWSPNMRCKNNTYNHTLPLQLLHDGRLVKTSNSEYFLVLMYDKPQLKQNKSGISIIDIGLRTFLTIKDVSDNTIKEIGHGTSYHVGRYRTNINKLQSKIDIEKRRPVLDKVDKRKKHRRIHNLQRAIKRLRKKIDNMINDLHKCAAKYLCENNSLILISKLNFHRLRNLNKRTKSVMQIVSPCKFVDRLIMKSKQYTNCKVEIIDESYTSKTCSKCGTINSKLGASKIFSCPSCNYQDDRDHNATKNIFDKFLYERVDLCSLINIIYP